MAHAGKLIAAQLIGTKKILDPPLSHNTSGNSVEVSRLI